MLLTALLRREEICSFTPAERFAVRVKNAAFMLLFLSGLLHVQQAQAAQLKSVQSNTATISSGSASTTATITSVDMTKTFLIFNTALDSAVTSDPKYGLVTGKITNSTTLTFNRISTTGTVTIKWYVAEFLSGVSVQRGSVTSPAATTDVTISSVNTAKSFATVTAQSDSSSYNRDGEFYEARITSSTNLRILTTQAPTITFSVEWQVVEYTDSSVQSNQVSFSTTDTSKTATITSVNTGKSWLIYSYQSDSSSTDTGSLIYVRGIITNSTTLTFDRVASGRAITLTYFLVEFTDGTAVQHANSNFSTSTTQNNVTITSVDTSWAIAVGGLYGRGGKTTFATDDNPSSTAFTLDITSATNLRITRGVTGSATADVGWFVIQFIANPTAVRLSSFTANSQESGVQLSWKTGYEVDNLGFHIYREENGERVRLTPELVAGTALLAGSGTALTAGHSYSWWDDPGISGQRSEVSGQHSSIDPQSSILHPQSSSVRYWLEDIDLNGTRTWHGPVTPVVSHEALPQRVKPELLSEVAARLGARYDDFWRAQDLKEKLRQSSAIRRTGSARVVRSASTAVGRQQNKQNAVQRVQASKQDQTKQWNLASRPAVKLLVKDKGWYRVTRSELLGAGLSPSANPGKLQLYRDGKEQPIKVVSQENGRTQTLIAVEFYGDAFDTPSTDTRTYWLIEGRGRSKRIEESRSRKQGSLGAPSFPYTVEKKDRVFYFAALKNGEAESFFGPLVTTEPVDQILTVAHHDPLPPQDPVLEVVLQGGTNVAHRVQVLFNEIEVGEVIFAGQSRSEATFSIPRSYLLDGDNVVTLVSQGGETDISLIDGIRLTYWHSYTADNDSLRFSAQGGEQVSIDGFSQTLVRVVDVTDPNAVQEVAGQIQPNGTGYAVTVQVPGQGSRTLLALTENQAMRPVSLQANQPSAWHKRAKGADLVIVSHKNFLDQVEPLKALRQAQGLAVALIDVEDLYDEFNFGVKSPEAIKDFLALTRANRKTAPRFVLLVGDASFDPKNYLGFGDNDLVPTKLVETTYFKTASDDWFVDFDGNGLPEIAIGRLPVRTLEEATTVISKIINYEQGAASTTRNALLVADRNDGFDFEGASEQIETLLPASLVVQKIFRNDFASDAEAKSTLITSLNQGALLVNYAGHGSVEIMRGIFSSDDARTLTNGSLLPFFVSMTCLNGFFHDVYTESLAEVLLKAEQGGAVAVWTSSALTEPWEQGVMNRELMRLLFNGESLTLGEAAMKAKSQVTDPDIRRSWILFGDPTTRLR